jgi:hypothetical protein
VVIHNLNIVCVSFAPNEAETPLIVDANAILSPSVATQGFQMISRRRHQISQFSRAVQLPKLPPRDMLDRLKTATWLPLVKSPSFRGAERLNHNRVLYNVPRFTSTGK